MFHLIKKKYEKRGKKPKRVFFHKKIKTCFKLTRLKTVVQMQTDWVFRIFCTLIKAGKLHCAFPPFLEHFKGVLPTRKINISRSLSLDTFKRVCEDFYFQSRNFLNWHSFIMSMIRCKRLFMVEPLLNPSSITIFTPANGIVI